MFFCVSRVRGEWGKTGQLGNAGKQLRSYDFRIPKVTPSIDQEFLSSLTLQSDPRMIEKFSLFLAIPPTRLAPLPPPLKEYKEKRWVHQKNFPSRDRPLSPVHPPIYTRRTTRGSCDSSQHIRKSCWIFFLFCDREKSLARGKCQRLRSLVYLRLLYR